MRISCNGCRVLRKGCSDNCSIRPCLDCIKNPECQANATVFLAKFYGRAGLINLINAGPRHLRPAIFNSLLYEACGRMVNPIYGSAGLLSSGNWQLCQKAVEAALKGDPITPLAVDTVTETKAGQPIKAAYDIRHVNKEGSLSESNDLHRVRKRCRFKRSGGKAKQSRVWVESVEESGREQVNASPSHGSSLSHQSEAAEPNVQRSESLGSAEPEPALNWAREDDRRRADDGAVDLDLTLGFKPFKQSSKRNDPGRRVCKIELGLDFPVAS